MRVTKRSGECDNRTDIGSLDMFAQSGLTLCDAMDSSLDFSIPRGIFQARVLGRLPFPSPITCIFSIKNAKYDHWQDRHGPENPASSI